jgi:hypothetical protein
MRGGATMKKVKLNRRGIVMKISAIFVATIIVISSATAIEVRIRSSPGGNTQSNIMDHRYRSKPFEAKSILAQAGLWIAFDSSAPGTPAKAHVSVSDTSGIIIVADFHGFWKNNSTVNGTEFDSLEMPGTGSIQSPGLPILPSLLEYIKIPYDVDISIEIKASSTDSISGYNITPSTGLDVPVPFLRGLNDTLDPFPTFSLNPVYYNDTFFPGRPVSIEGGENASSLFMRGHRLVGLSFYPVQYNPVSSTLLVYSQIVVKLKYSFPAQIQPVEERLQSEVFDMVLSNTVLNYGSCNNQYAALTSSTSTSSALAQTNLRDPEHLIITTEEYKEPANKLAKWKTRKGVPSEVITITATDPDDIRDEVKSIIREAYENGNPPPTYVLLLGDVEDIPTNYETRLVMPTLFLPGMNRVASDQSYFNMDEHGYIPEMIHGRISVDTVEQARVIVNKILAYERTPPSNVAFFNSTLFAGDFYDWEDMNAVEDTPFPFLSALERIRHYLKDEYTTHINYSCQYLHYDRIADGYEAYRYTASPANKDIEELEFYASPISWSDLVSESIDDIDNFGWLMSYDSYYGLGGRDNPFYQLARGNITPNMNEGRFLVLYFGHGGSKNMVFPENLFTDQRRGSIEGWQHPFFNTSYVSDLTNGGEVPLIINIACDTGWFDGEHDGENGHNFIGDEFLSTQGNNLFAEYSSECFAENITRLDTGGAIAVIASSRPGFAGIGAHLMDGLIQAFWPGFLGSTNQPIYEMGAALLFGKLYAVGKWNELRSDTLWGFREIMYPLHKAETTFAEYHLFGDPETQLWTDNPIPIVVDYPDAVGTTNPQRFVVSVNNSDTGAPISFAKVCLQQGIDDVYEVKYTDPNGQAVFEVNPSASYSHINLTVTKHNVRPNITSIDVIDSEASISLSAYEVMVNNPITISFNDFLTDTSKEVFINGTYIVSLDSGDSNFQWTVDPGATKYMNVEVVSSIGVAVDCFQRVSSLDGPDPWIESPHGQTWSATEVWDNPDIDIYRDGVLVDSMTQNADHEIIVTVHNNGLINADSTKVNLSYAPFGGGVTWTPIGEATVSPTQERAETATFHYRPTTGQSACFRVDLFHPDERDENKANNIGYENVNVIQICSPGTGSFLVGNPTNVSGYVSIRVTQQGDHDIWNASIIVYSSQVISAGSNETVTLLLDPLSAPNETRYFSIDIFVNCTFVGGMIYRAIPGDRTLLYIIVGGLAISFIALVVVYVKMKQGI